MSVRPKTGSGRGGAREGSGPKVCTLAGMLKRSKHPERLRREMKRRAFQLIIDWARGEMRTLAK